MNARQKAKKLKKELYDLKGAYKVLERNNKYLRWEKTNRPSIETCKLKIFVPYLPIDTSTDDAFINTLYESQSQNAKSQLAKEIANFLIDNNLIVIENEKNDLMRATIYTASLKVVRQ